ncbi:hypothetical protein [Arthrobacter sp. H16F315]|uniref:hypothetical protein n=1 Tax=Arthrobacter sp. H16F315 TaxID=2955314 RepID=UPI0020983EA3|nr:hypothetical protein [Arthrobacter sp. H16F315]MDD1475739.1 hypothetical protein [Arthrobacter sp. H16F315]
MKKLRTLTASIGTVALSAMFLIGAPAPAMAGVGGCSSLAADGQYIVGSCTANNPGPNATITVAHSCFGLKNGASIRKTITVGYGSSFRVKSSCWTWVTQLDRVG